VETNGDLSVLAIVTSYFGQEFLAVAGTEEIGLMPKV